MSELLMGAVSGPVSAHRTQALWDGVHQGGHGWPWGPPGAQLPDAEDQLGLAVPQQGC